MHKAHIVITFILLAITHTLDAQSRFTSFDDTVIAYTDEGQGTPVILLHGFINDASSWNGTKIKELLLQNNYRVIAPDLRGNGKSDQPSHEEAYQNNAEVKDLKGLIDHLHLDHIIAIGYSRGSIILAQWLTEETRIQKAVIGGMGLDFSDPLWDRRIIFEEAFLNMTPLTAMTEGAVNYAKSKHANLQALGWSQRYQPAPSVDELAKIMTKTLVIAGDQDTDNGQPKELSDLLPNATLTIVPGDHNTTYRKTPFAKEVLAFLKNK